MLAGRHATVYSEGGPAQKQCGAKALGSSRSSGLVQNRYRAGHLCHAKNQQRRIRTRFDAGIGVVDVEAGIAESRGGACQLARPMLKFDLGHVGFCEGEFLRIEDGAGRRWIVNHQVNQAGASGRELLEGQDVHTAVSQRPADTAQSPRAIFHADCKFPRRRHCGIPPLPVCRKPRGRSGESDNPRFRDTVEADDTLGVLPASRYSLGRRCG